MIQRKLIILLALAIASVTQMQAQQLGSYKLFHLNPYLTNPAAAGTTPYVFVSSSYTQSWSGIQGAPVVQNINAHALIGERTAFGGKISGDNSGLSGRIGAEVSYAYHLPINANGTKFSFGVSALLTQHRMFKDKFILAHPDDEVVINSQNGIIVPDAAFGVSLYHANTFYFNLASYQLLGRKVSFLNEEELDNVQVRHYFVSAGYKFILNDNFKLEPSAMFKFNEVFINQADLGFKVEFKEILSVGCFYSTNEALSPYLGINTKHLSFGYSYGLLLNNLSDYTVGTHEIMLILKINNTKSSI